MTMGKKAEKATKPKTLLDLERNDCRWPIGEPRHPDFHFCGAPQTAGRPYCELHWRMAFQPARPRHQPAVPSVTAKAA
jgi:GcrA cell cycle regulator